MEAVRVVTGTAVPLDRSDVDTDQIIPAEWLKRVERTGFGEGLFSEWRTDPASSSTARARRRHDPGGRPELRHGLVAGARRVGPARLRLPGGRVAPLRRHLPQQLHQGRPAARPGRRRDRQGSCWPPSRPTRAGRDRRRRARPSWRRPPASRRRSPSTTSPSSASWRASTTSASPCAASRHHRLRGVPPGPDARPDRCPLGGVRPVDRPTGQDGGVDRPVIRPISAAETWPLRHRVLRPGQPFGQTAYPRDDHPETAHFGVFDGDRLVGVGLDLPGGPTRPAGPGVVADARAGHRARDVRGRGLGTALMGR